MRTPSLIVLLLVCLIWGLQARGSNARQKEAGATSAPASDGLIKVTIATGGGLHGPVKTKFKVGEEIPMVISMANMGDEPAKYCLSTTVIQNRPPKRRTDDSLPHQPALTIASFPSECCYSSS